MMSTSKKKEPLFRRLGTSFRHPNTGFLDEGGVAEEGQEDDDSSASSWQWGKNIAMTTNAMWETKVLYFFFFFLLLLLMKVEVLGVGCGFWVWVHAKPPSMVGFQQ
jgi:hypothetical protein